MKEMIKEGKKYNIILFACIDIIDLKKTKRQYGNKNVGKVFSLMGKKLK